MGSLSMGILERIRQWTTTVCWAWLIDLSGWFLVSVTGLGLLVYLKKFRISALIAMLVLMRRAS